MKLCFVCYLAELLRKPGSALVPETPQSTLGDGDGCSHKKLEFYKERDAHDVESRVTLDLLLDTAVCHFQEEVFPRGTFSWALCLLLGSKAVTNLNSVLKSRDITLPAKVPIVKSMFFPVVMY